ncbi:MAG: hypothetical protein E5X59_00765 [Mesorhizobium sp.]|nr:MAG: hypothetical protein E5X59_00765 [Mesorhizobium sp.]
MSQGFDIGRWSGGLAEWTDDDTAYLSVAFTWRLNDAYQRACWYKAAGYKVRAGGPGIFTRKHFLADVAEIGGSIPDAVVHHNPMATFASRGCPVGCWFCIVPKLEGKTFTLIPDFPVRPVLCDNNLSALPTDFQDHVISRYRAAGVPLMDANSGFEPRTFDDEVFARWSTINVGPWRFAYDDQAERPFVERVMHMLRDVPSRKKRVYVLVGNEPMAACIERVREVIAWGGEPHVRPYMKLNALERKPHVRFDWSEQSLRDLARWSNRYLYKYTDFEGYQRSAKTARQGERSADLFDAVPAA